MIKCDNEVLEIEGTRIELIMDLSRIIKALGPDQHVFSKESLHRFVDAAFMTKEELEAESIKSIERLLKNLTEFQAMRDEDCDSCSKKDTCEHSNCKQTNNSKDTFEKLFKDIFGDKN